MPLDHYVSQVHLRRFYSPALGNRVYAIRKSDLKAFTPRSEDVCRIMDGSTNVYLRENRYIEDFLKTIEPNYNAALDKLISGPIDKDCIYAIAGFVAYVISCSPAGMRIGCDPLKNIVESTTAMMDAKGSFPPPPPQLGNTTLTELIRDGVISVTIDPKFPQALGINTILSRTATFGNCKWEILHNDFDDSPFCTSDFPAAIEETGDPRILNRIVPLAPNLAIRTKPSLTIGEARPDFSFPDFGCHRRKISFKELVRLNCLIVRCAEDLVFHRDDSPWVRSVVAKNRHYRVEPYTHRLPTSTGEFLVPTQRVVPMTPPPDARRSHSG
jgi:hypothetical protein